MWAQISAWRELYLLNLGSQKGSVKLIQFSLANKKLKKYKIIKNTIKDDARGFRFSISGSTDGYPLEGDVVVRHEGGNPEQPDAVLVGGLELTSQGVQAQQVAVVRVSIGDVLKHHLKR
jgi:hypothetical protein